MRRGTMYPLGCVALNAMRHIGEGDRTTNSLNGCRHPEQQSIMNGKRGLASRATTGQGQTLGLLWTIIGIMGGLKERRTLTRNNREVMG